MDLEQIKEPKRFPYPASLFVVVAGGFFLLGVGVSVFTLNSVEASYQSTSESDLNLEGFVNKKQSELKLTTDVASYTIEKLAATVTYEYPSEWDHNKGDSKAKWDHQYSMETEFVYFDLSPSSSKTHIETAANYLSDIGVTEDQLTLIEGGESSREKLIYAIYSYELEEGVAYISVVDVTDNTDSGVDRMIINSNLSSNLIQVLVNSVNVTFAN